MKNLKICFEGPSAVGKTTLCQQFANSHEIIPEVNLLFQRGEDENRYWYLERQVDRFKLATESPRPAIFDGDIFQPVWYNWIYRDRPNQLNQEEILNFYQTRIRSKEIKFPDVYFVFHASEFLLRQRKERDHGRKRRHFEKHLRLIEPQQEYFHFLKEATHIQVEFIEFSDLHSTYAEVNAVLNGFSATDSDHEEALDFIGEWLKDHPIN